MEAKITKRSVDALEAMDGEETRIWDTELRGFGIRCRPSGDKYYFLKYRTLEGRQRWATIGKHGSPWSPDDARKAALLMLGKVATGEDPGARRTELRPDLTIAELCDRYLDQPVIITRKGTPKKASTLMTDRSNVERHIKPLLGRTKVKALTRRDAERFQRDVAVGKTKADVKTKKQGRAIVRGGKGTAARATALLGALMTYAVDEGLRTDNPVSGVVLFKNQKRDRFLTPEEMADLGKVLDQCAAEGANSSMLTGIALLIMTGCRKNEIMKVRWEWIDFERGLFRFPTARRAPR